MPAYRDGNRWRYRKWVTLRDGRRIRITGTPAIETKQAAEAAERAHIERALNPTQPERKEVPTYEKFADAFLDISKAQNKASTVQTKESILRVHLIPSFGKQKLDEISFGRIQDYAAAKVKKLGKKTVNNHLSILRRMLVLAKKRSLIAAVPEIEWLKAPKPEFDFLTFDEADRLLLAADGAWRPMILTALRTGMRQSELVGLRWEDVDLVAGQISVRQAVVRGIIGTPKSGKSRHIPLGNEVLAVLKRYRHLKGEYVFSSSSGCILKKNELKHPLWRACRRAGLRKIGWHVLRHTFASHLVMRGVPVKVVQELLGHSTIEMTMRYAHLSPDVPKDAVKVLDRGRLGNGWATAEQQAGSD